MRDIIEETIYQTLTAMVANDLITAFNLTRQQDICAVSLERPGATVAFAVTADNDAVDTANALLEEMQQAGVLVLYDVIGRVGSVAYYLDIVIKTVPTIDPVTIDVVLYPDLI